MKSLRQKLPQHTAASFLAGAAIFAVSAYGQLASAPVSFINVGKLPPALASIALVMGSRMTTATNASVTLGGTMTDANGSRAATIMIQAPGLLSYRDSKGYAVTFDGTSFSTNSGAPTASDEPIMESLLAHLPDAVLLQALNGSGVRIIGSHFRTDNGKTVNYSGPYWTVIEFQPAAQTGMTWGQPLQQELFLAIDEKSGLPAETRRAVKSGNAVNVTQTQFLNWSNQKGQWFPGNIVRLEAGKQTLSFQVQSASTGTAAAAAVFQP